MDPKRFLQMILVWGVLGSCFIGISAMGQTEPKGGMNVLRREMLALEEVFETIIDAVIFENMELIKPQIPPFHEARKIFEEAINAGEKIELPKNQDKFKAFVKLDNKFQKKFEALEEAAEKGQKEVVKDQIHKLFDACVVCHEKFRK
jgi:cytochrome c556